MAPPRDLTFEEKSQNLLFPKESNAVLEAVLGLPEQDIRRMLKVSDKQWADVYELWNKPQSYFVKPQTGEIGANAYTGEAYKSLNLSGFSDRALALANTNLATISALYGLVFPHQPVAPYRLEMQAKVPNAPFGTLYKLWKPVITHFINQHPSSFVLDACSGEYSKAVDWKKIDKPVVHVDFKQNNGERIQSISVFSKQARGALARWVLESGITRSADIVNFKEDGYSIYQQQDNKVVFLRNAR